MQEHTNRPVRVEPPVRQPSLGGRENTARPGTQAMGSNQIPRDALRGRTQGGGGGKK